MKFLFFHLSSFNFLGAIIMSRVTVAIISIFGSVMLYLCLRLLKKYRITTRVQNAVMFLPTALIFGLRAYVSGEQLRVGWHMLLIMIPLYVLVSWLPNLMSLKSMQKAPNIGYSLMISKSYVVIAAVLAVPFFGSELTLINIIAIAMIIGFMTLLLIEPKKATSNIIGPWAWYAGYACIGRAGLSLSSKRFIQQGITPLVVNFWIFFIVSIIIIAESIIKKDTIIPPTKGLFPTLGVIIAMVIFNRALQKGYSIAPNPGYINAANASSIAILTLVSSRIFGDELSGRKLLGIGGIIIGIAILFII